MSKFRLLGVLLLGCVLLAPASVRAGEEQRHRHNDIVITRNAAFDKAHGIRSGRGTAADPYVISGWNVSGITIADTSKAFRIENNTIGWLTLNWNGPNVEVVRNDIGDMRVNENVRRTGAPTSGRIHRNTFTTVSQIRHFDGRFVHNTVDARSMWDDVPFVLNQAVNFDGFNGATFAHNTIYGFVEARLHGHHHSSGYGDGSHMHAAMKGHHHDMVDHTDRWHEVLIADNHIVTPAGSPYGLIYTDSNHAGNDRTANSETDKALEKPHVHHTRVHIMDNVLEGAGITIDIFNARDERHTGIRRGLMHLEGNRISLVPGSMPLFNQGTNGVDVWDARGLTLHIIDTVVTTPARDELTPWDASLQYAGTGINLNRIDRADVMIAGARIQNMSTGVWASQMTSKVRWSIDGLKTSGVDRRVRYDDSVENKPE